MFVPSLLLAVVTAATPSEAAAERVLRQEVVVDAPPDEVWRMYTTPEGITSWMAAFAAVDLRVGGTIETSYDADAASGDPNNIVQRILAYEPGVMFASRCEQAPANSPYRDVAAALWGVTRFEALPGGRTRVVGSMLGWPEGPEADAAYAFFERVNPMVYETLRKRFAGRRPDAEATMDALLDHVGVWVHSSEPAGGPFRSLNVLERGPHPRTIVGRSWNGDAARLRAHGATNVWIEPGEGVVRFSSIDEQAAIARGVVRLSEDGKTLTWDWGRTGADGEHRRFDIEMLRLAQDRYRMTMFGRSIEYERVAEVPEPFRAARERGREE